MPMNTLSLRSRSHRLNQTLLPDSIKAPNSSTKMEPRVIATDNSWHAEPLTFDAAGHPIIHQNPGHAHAGGAAAAAADHAHMPNGGMTSTKSEAWANAMAALNKKHKDNPSAPNSHAPAPPPPQPQPAPAAGGMFNYPAPYG
jgi:hypothetical protein